LLSGFFWQPNKHFKLQIDKTFVKGSLYDYNITSNGFIWIFYPDIGNWNTMLNVDSKLKAKNYRDNYL
jgi:hypothetical protein